MPNPDSVVNYSPPPPKPLKVVFGGGPGFECHETQAISTTSNFELPQGWVVEVRHRGPNSSIKMSDKYYYEPGTGRKFRSLLSVKRYLNGEEEMLPLKRQNNCLVPCQNSGSFKRVVYGGKVLRPDELEEAHHRNSDDIIPKTSQLKTFSVIPDGWIVEEVPRRDGFRSDRYFIEPVTGRRFRSVPEIQRYLAGENCRPKCRTINFTNHKTAPRTPTQRRKSSAKMLNAAISDVTKPPAMVNWAYSGNGGEKWSPLLEECVLPDYVKEQWAETFLVGMNGAKQQVP